jgi:hypothetical protein
MSFGSAFIDVASTKCETADHAAVHAGWHSESAISAHLRQAIFHQRLLMKHGFAVESPLTKARPFA